MKRDCCVDFLEHGLASHPKLSRRITELYQPAAFLEIEILDRFLPLGDPSVNSSNQAVVWG